MSHSFPNFSVPVQEQVWDVVFQAAKKLDVQIFATAHSLDALKNFRSLRTDSFEKLNRRTKVKRSNGHRVLAASPCEAQIRLHYTQMRLAGRGS